MSATNNSAAGCTLPCASPESMSSDEDDGVRGRNLAPLLVTPVRLLIGESVGEAVMPSHPTLPPLMPRRRPPIHYPASPTAEASAADPLSTQDPPPHSLILIIPPSLGNNPWDAIVIPMITPRVPISQPYQPINHLDPQLLPIKCLNEPCDWTYHIKPYPTALH
jgi:hypothetical protein